MLENSYKMIEAVVSMCERILPSDVEMYDFGGRNVVAPVPDTKQTEGYLTSHMVAVWRKRNSPYDPYIVTGFSFDLQFITPAKLQTGIEKAAEKNRTQTEQFVILTQKETK